MTFVRWLVTVGMLAAAFSPARAADMPGQIYVPGPIVTSNPCADPKVRGRIIERFAWAEQRTWQRGFVMASLENPRLSGHPFYEPGLIHREYCMADATMSNGAPHTVFYAIEFGQGFASLGNYVNFCVLGLDPWHIYDEACRTVR